MSKYSVELYPGEDGERLPAWEVVRWDSEMNGVKIGSCVFRSYNMMEGEQECEDYMAFLIDMDEGNDQPSFDDINAELAEIAELERLDRIQSEYEELYEDLMNEHDMQMRACHSYDEELA